MKGIWHAICFGCLGLALAAILAACSSGDGGEYALRAVMSTIEPVRGLSDTDLKCDLRTNDITVGEEALMLLQSSFGGWRVVLTGPRLTLLEAPANAELDQLGAAEWRLELNDLDAGDTEVRFVPLQEGEHAIDCKAGLMHAVDTMRVVGD